MKWCKVMNMWCSDMDEEDIDNVGCDGECDNCDAVSYTHLTLPTKA